MKKILILAFFVFFKLAAEQDGVEVFPEKVVISLGYSCTPADMLRFHNIRCLAFPLDWVRCSFDGLCNLLENDFSDFLNPQYLTFEKTFILNNKYTIAFHHDFPAERTEGRVDYIKENFVDYLPDVLTKYQRRINRFYNVLNSEKTVYFFRLSSYTRPWNLDMHHQTKEDVIRLRDILLGKFPSCNFILVVIDSDEEYKTEWNLERVQNFHIQNINSKEEWFNIFKTLGLVQAN